MKNKKDIVKFGRCALTGEVGAYVKSHIIPEALTESSVWRNRPLTQRGRSGGYIRRWTSWYDPMLVTQAGENVLQRYDNWAVNFMRKNKLIWSSWGPMTSLSKSYMDYYDDRLGLGMRTVKTAETAMFRLFYISILWRAAVCNLWEFNHIKISDGELEKLRQMILNNNPKPWDSYPVSIIQLCTRTVPFNQALSLLTKEEPTLWPDGQATFTESKKIKFFRVYFDGLAVSLNIDEDPQHFLGAKRVFVSEDADLKVLVLPSERSAHVSCINFERGLAVPPEHLPSLFEIYK